MHVNFNYYKLTYQRREIKFGGQTLLQARDMYQECMSLTRIACSNLIHIL
jgi:hypothetical protein